MVRTSLVAAITSVALAAGGISFAATRAAGGEDATAGQQAEQGQSKKAKIRNALSAAPPAVAKRAAVMDWGMHGGEMPMLRKGTNGFTCLPDDPMTPSNDPQCMNDQAMAWMDAWMAKTEPKLDGPGLSYVLRGCTVASNTDPFAMEPAAGKKWIATGPHVMVFPTEKLDRKAYGTNPNKGLPYIRWAGTPYEHLVVPVPALHS